MTRYQFNCSGAPEQAGHGAPRLSYIAKDQFSTDWSSELHTHDCAELFFILDGHGHFRTLYEEFPISVQDLLIVNANIPHTEVSSLKSPLQYIVLGIEGLEAAASEEGYAMLHISDGWAELNSCVSLMLQESANTPPGHEEVCRHLLEVVLIRLERQHLNPIEPLQLLLRVQKFLQIAAGENQISPLLGIRYGNAITDGFRLSSDSNNCHLSFKNSHNR